MHTTQQLTTEFRVTAVCTVTDPAERERRLTQAYGLIMSFGRQKKAVAETEPNALAPTAS